MHKGRVEAFSDGVIAIIITIMVLELRAPHEPTIAALWPLAPVFGSYVLSFIYVGIYWNNHHHMFQLVRRVNGAVLWANLHLLFWLSLVPFVTNWMGENHLESAPAAIYGFVLLMCAVAYLILARTLERCEGANSALAAAIGNDRKGKISILIYLAGMALAFVGPWFGIACYVLVALIWLVPDRRIERNLAAHHAAGDQSE
ncbi:TMEM175 family protein [Kaistia dalseonensis]|uniref:Membrane protein n=1 Tax=Kaistia dalseonensis TaxID=410840 RepID=A0ABU0H9B5_9HYPH|nr:TMEM175 family protein [Kaistia dalseonensis]MCX5495465.1 TMEM175 family protein [Kaistia dalseonensis]MDQ0438056.1 putative membrane protein [Kaistia dalseonensis]